MPEWASGITTGLLTEAISQKCYCNLSGNVMQISTVKHFVFLTENYKDTI